MILFLGLGKRVVIVHEGVIVYFVEGDVLSV